MRTIKIGAIALSMCFVLAAVAPAQNADKEKPAADQKEKDFTDGPGIEIGNDMPDIKLKNQDGNEVSIHELLKANNVALVFYRSADWWPFCKKHLVQLQKDAKKFEKAGIQLVGISYDDVDILKGFAEKRKISFPLLSDEDSKIIRALDIEDRKGLPHSGTFLIDQEKKVRAKIFYDGYRKRHPNVELMEAAKSVGLAK